MKELYKKQSNGTVKSTEDYSTTREYRKKKHEIPIVEAEEEVRMFLDNPYQEGWDLISTESWNGNGE